MDRFSSRVTMTETIETVRADEGRRRNDGEEGGQKTRAQGARSKGRRGKGMGYLIGRADEP